jgi:hypothetical protein
MNDLEQALKIRDCARAGFTGLQARHPSDNRWRAVRAGNHADPYYVCATFANRAHLPLPFFTAGRFGHGGRLGPLSRFTLWFYRRQLAEARSACLAYHQAHTRKSRQMAEA